MRTSWTSTLPLAAAVLVAAMLGGCSKSPEKKDLRDAHIQAVPPSAAPAPSAAVAPSSLADTADPAEAIQAIAESKRYLLLGLHRGAEGAGSGLLGGLETLAQPQQARAAVVLADLNDTRLAKHFAALGIDPAVCPVPLLMVVSPNKLVTGTFTKTPSAEALGEALLPAEVLAIREQLAAGKTVWVVASGPRSEGTAETRKNLAAFLADPANADAKSMVVRPLDITKADNGAFLKALHIDPQSAKCVTLVLAPPLKILAKPILGAASLKAIKDATKPCDSCGPGG